ncbi:hypothetical protein DFH09DRAFT_1107160 [Mycena vulgaris]|nr:hypothetical protein DFH09DRAFT_1107160 [Mycena vulgaris]
MNRNPKSDVERAIYVHIFTAFPPPVDRPLSTYVVLHAATCGDLRLRPATYVYTETRGELDLRPATVRLHAVDTVHLPVGYPSATPTSLNFMTQICPHLANNPFWILKLTQASIYPSSTGVDGPSVYMRWERSDCRYSERAWGRRAVARLFQYLRLFLPIDVAWELVDAPLDSGDGHSVLEARRSVSMRPSTGFEFEVRKGFVARMVVDGINTNSDQTSAAC